MSDTILQTGLADRPLVPSSALKLLSAVTEEPSLEVSLMCGGNTIYSGNLAAYGNIVELHDPASLIEAWFRANNRVVATVTVRFGLAVLPVTVLYCEYDLPDEPDFSQSYLSLISAQRVHRGSVVTIAADSFEALKATVVTAVGVDSDGIARTVEFPLNISSTVAPVSVSVPVDTLLRYAGALADVHCFSFDSGDRQKVFFLVNDTRFITIGFKSAFNVREYIDIPGTVVHAAEVTVENATLDRTLVQYNRKSSHTYEVTTAALTREEAEAFAQIVESRETVLRSGGVDYPIVITDHTIESSDDDSSLPSMKFTYRYAGDRPALFASGASPFVEPDRIFTAQYSKQYS